jgi:hypothetical protein
VGSNTIGPPGDARHEHTILKPAPASGDRRAGGFTFLWR